MSENGRVVITHESYPSEQDTAVFDELPTSDSDE